MAEKLSRRSTLKWMTGSAAASASVASGAPNETEPAPPDYPVRFNMHDPDYSKPATGRAFDFSALSGSFAPMATTPTARHGSSSATPAT